MNAKHTAMATEDERNQIDTVIHHESRLAHVPPLPELPLPLPPTSSELPNPTIPVLPISRILPFVTLSKRKHGAVNDIALATMENEGGDNVDADGDVICKRHKRKCWRCGSLGCRGNGRGGNCKNPCQDCGDREGNC
ncbi:hypothetical protein L208DRAFT_1512510, partial [Tricholoma matsutake]